MSLYYDAASVLSSQSHGGSLKSRIYNNHNFKSKPAHIYALISEAARYDVFIKEVIENANILPLEPKLTPLLALLLVHDYVFSKGGIAAPVNHPLRQAVERHKVRIKAESTKSRLRKKCASLDELKVLLQSQRPQGSKASQPRWVRINRVKSSLAEQLKTTFAGYTSTSVLTELGNQGASDKVIYIDPNVPDVIALPADEDLSKTTAYRNGELILQDKASCIPAHLLLGSSADRDRCGDIIDACAAPGNKTTHLASILSPLEGVRASAKVRIFACERDARRSHTLQKMVGVAGAESSVTVLLEQDFLALDPNDERFANVTHLLLDPSCSGSGIIGREDIPVLALPEVPGHGRQQNPKQSKKRKRNSEDVEIERDPGTSLQTDAMEEEEVAQTVDSERLAKLSNLQSRIVEHAFAFPAARKVTYSTCSIHNAENESVVARALRSQIALERSWRILQRQDQVQGLRKWQLRGVTGSDVTRLRPSDEETLSEEEREACIRCVAGTKEGTMGFFVCGFVRTEQASHKSSNQKVLDSSENPEEDWEGFSDHE